MSFKDIKALLIDLSGTIHIDSQEIDGAAEAVKKLKDANIPIKFVTNTTKESQSRLHKRLQDISFPIRSEDIFSSLTAAKDLIIKENLRPMLLLEDEAMEDFSGINTNNPNAVVIGLAPSKFNYETMTEAFRILLNGASLIAIHKARYFKRTDGLALGPGCFISGLEYSSGKEAKVVGKPNPNFFQLALEKLNSQMGTNYLPKEVLMIGDDVRDDVIGAQKSGFKGCLVKTGKYKPMDETRYDEKINFTFECFSTFVDEFLRCKL